MFIIDGSTISLTRGDTLCLNIELTKDDEPYVPESGDLITFALKKSFTDPVPLIRKDVHPGQDNSIVVEIVPADTKKLNFGTYKYDMQLTDVNARVYTFILGDFILTEEVS